MTSPRFHSKYVPVPRIAPFSPISSAIGRHIGVDMDMSLLELTVLSLLAATCCVAAWSLQVEKFPVLFAVISLFAAITAMWRRLMTSR
jgi:hypothetical protein